MHNDSEIECRFDDATRLSARVVFYFLGMLGVIGGTIIWLLYRKQQELEVAFSSHLSALAAQPSGLLASLLIALLAIIAIARLLNIAFRALGQPAVVGEICAGLLLGPSALGHYYPETFQYLFSKTLIPAFSSFADLGIVLYMFIVGLDFSPQTVNGKRPFIIILSISNIAVPFISGVLLAFWLFPDFAGAGVRLSTFAAFVGIAMAITAFPVLARILEDVGIQKTNLGILVLSSVAISDASSWILLSLILGIAHENFSFNFSSLLLYGASLGASLVLVRQWLVRFSNRIPSEAGLVMLIIVVLAAAVSTESIGLHAIFGAFIVGTLVPSESPLAQDVAGKLKNIIKTLFLPAFFACAGLKANISLISSFTDWCIFAWVLLAAFGSKFLSAALPTFLCRMPWRESIILGTLLNVRGLVELIVLKIGLELGIISDKLFSIMVLMALATTLFATPALKGLLPKMKTKPAVMLYRISP